MTILMAHVTIDYSVYLPNGDARHQSSDEITIYEQKGFRMAFGRPLWGYATAMKSARLEMQRREKEALK